jgi:hypothetical protein
VPALPREDGLVDVGGGREHAPGARFEHGGQRRRVDWDRGPGGRGDTHRSHTFSRRTRRRRRPSASRRRVQSRAGMPVTPPPRG